MASTIIRDGQFVVATRENPSHRKPHNWWAGYVAERRNRITGDYNVLVDAEAQGLDPAGGRWNLICNAHGTILSHTNQRTLRTYLVPDGSLEWCDGCRDIDAGRKGTAGDPPGAALLKEAP